MRRVLLCGFIFIALTTLTVSKKNDRESIERVGIELDVLKGNARITYNDEWNSEAEVLYAKKKKVIAYKDTENEWCLLEKIQQRALVSEEHYTRQFEIINKPLEKYQLERLGGKKIVTFCAKHTSIVLIPFPRDGRREKSNGKKRVKREMYPLQRNETQVSHQEASKKLLEDLSIVQSLGSSRTSHGKGLKRNAEDRVENSRGLYPSSSAKVGHSPGIDYHAHIRNNIYPGTHAVHPIDITSSVTITTGSSHKIWSYPPSSGGYHNDTAASHPSGTSNLTHSLHKNTSHDISAHGVQHSHSLHHPYPSFLSQNQGHYPPSASRKSQQSPAIYPPSSTSKTQAPLHYPSSSVSKNHQGPAYYPPSATSKSQQSTTYFAPSSSSKTQAPAPYPPSATTKTQRPSGYFPSSSSTNTQPPPYYLPSAAAKYQPPFGHYPPSSSNKNQGPAIYPQSSTSRSQQTPAYYPPSSSSKNQGLADYPPSSTSKSQQTPAYYPPSSTSKNQGLADYPPSSTSTSQQTPAYYPPSSSSKPQQGKALYSLSGTKPQHGHEHYPPSSVSTSQHYLPSVADKSQHTPGHYPPSSISKLGHDQYPPSSTPKTHHLQQNITAGSPSGGERQFLSVTGKFPSPSQYSPSGSESHNHVVTSQLEQPTYVPPSSTSKIHHQPQNRTHFQYNNLYSYGIVPGMYAPQFPSSSTSKLYPAQQFPSSLGNVNHAPQSGNDGVHYRKHPNSFAQYPPSSTTNFHTKLDQSGGHTSNFPPSSTTKMDFPLSMHGSTAPVLEKPSAREHGSYPISSSAKEHPTINNVSQYPPSSTSKAHYVPSGGHIYGGTYQSHAHSPLGTKLPSSLPSGSPPSAQIPQPPVSGHFHTSLHMHSFRTQYYPPSASAKQPHIIPHSQTPRPLAHYPASTAKFHPVPKQNVSKHLPPEYYSPSSVGHHHDFHSGVSTPTHVPQYPPSAFSKSASNQGTYYHPQHYPRYASSHRMRNESSTTPGKSFSPSSLGHTFHSQQQYPPSSSSRIQPNASENKHPSPAIPLYPSGGQYYPTHSPYNLTVSHHHHQQSNIALQPHDKPEFQQGSTKPCQGSMYSITTRTIVTPNGVIQRPISVKNNGEPPCGHINQGTGPYAVPCGSIIKNGHSVKVQNPCTPNHSNQRKSMRNVLVPGPAMIPAKRTAEQGEFGSSDGVIITNVGESEAEVLDGIGYPVSHQRFAHLKDNSTSEEVEDFEGEENQTKSAEVNEKEKVEDIKEETSAKREEEEEVKEGDVLEPGDRILGKNGYTISDGFRGRVVSVSGQVGKTRTTKSEKKSNSAQFKYSSELGRYFKDDEEKRFSDCHGEVTFTCSEFLGSNGRAKICKPNPRKNPDGSPC